VECGSHGVCYGGACRCEEGWTGPVCGQKACHPLCSKNGVCKEGKCECDQGWTGEHCNIGEWITCHTHTHARTHTRTHTTGKSVRRESENVTKRLLRMHKNKEEKKNTRLQIGVFSPLFLDHFADSHRYVCSVKRQEDSKIIWFDLLT